jgi:hypothetical protein
MSHIPYYGEQEAANNSKQSVQENNKAAELAALIQRPNMHNFLTTKKDD